MPQSLPVSRTTFAAVLLLPVLAALWPGVGHAAAKHSSRAPAARTDIERDFSALAHQRPWLCAGAAAPGAPASAWRSLPAECAWQNRLRMRRWSGDGGVPAGACVSEQARWWAWARAGRATPGAPPQAWRSEWKAHGLHESDGAGERIVIVRAMPGGQWSATEWRWNPSPRAATRRWQAQRWALLAERAAQLRPAPAPADAAPEDGMLRATMDQHLAGRVGELAGGAWQWQADGLCLRFDPAALGQQHLQLPYSVDDSRLEQRAAMQLHLARRYPKATWLTTFRLVPAAPHARSGAKFYAVWREGATVKGQLWMPTRGDGPLVRVRIDAALPGARARGPQAQAAADADAGEVIGRELAMLARRWSEAHE